MHKRLLGLAFSTLILSSMAGGSAQSGVVKGIKLCYATEGQSVAVKNDAEFRDALGKAEPGQRITLAAGVYKGEYTYNTNATADKPVIIRPEKDAVVTFTGTVHLNGNYGVLKKMRFARGTLFVNGSHNRVSRNFFTGVSGNTITMDGNHSYNRIDHNEFNTFTGAAIEMSAGGNALNHTHIRIDHNYFTNHTVNGNSESVARMLTDAFSDSYLIYDHNLFDHVLNHRGDEGEIVSAKTGRVYMIANTVVNSEFGYLSLRETNRSVVEGNYLEGAGIYVMGDDHIVRGNKVIGANISVRAGNGTMSDPQIGCNNADKYHLTALLPPAKGCKSMHAAARGTQVYNNIGRIIVGEHYKESTVKARNTKLRNNASAATRVAGFEEGTHEETGTPVNHAVKLTPADVGLLAPDQACPEN